MRLTCMVQIALMLPAVCVSAEPTAHVERLLPPPAALFGWPLTNSHVGLGWTRYSEPIMALQGSTVTMRTAIERTPLGWMPEQIGGELTLSRLDYTSQQTGKLDDVPGVGWRVHALWSMPAMVGRTWRLGLEYEGFWNDLRGTSTTGHRGYERFSNKAWLQARAAPWAETELQLGVLLRGWQDSWLSQAHPALPNVTNLQSAGFTVRYQHSPWTLSGRPVQPWVRYTQIARSDEVTAQRWYEPRNRTLVLGLETRF